MYNFIKGVVLIALIIFLGMKISEQYSTPSPANTVNDTHKDEVVNQAPKAAEEENNKPAEASEQKTDVSPESTDKKSEDKQSVKKDSKRFLNEEDKRLTMMAKNEAKLKDSRDSLAAKPLEDLHVEPSGENYDPERLKNIGETYEKTISILNAME